MLPLVASLLVPGCRRDHPAAGRGAPSGPAIRFEEVTQPAGVRFTHYNGAAGRLLMPESLGNGCAFLDYDGDGWLDLFLVNSSNWPDRPPARRFSALYHNQRDGTFRDVTHEAGLEVPMYGMGCAVGDYDNDGRDDLLVTCLGPNHLFRNLGGGRFQDVTSGSGLEKAGRWSWHTSAAWLDYDRDGRLDLFVCRYVKWSPQSNYTPTSSGGRPTYSGPEHYPGDSCVLYRNLGGGKFLDVSARVGIASLEGKALGVLPIDENRDGWPDLVVANDTMANFLFRNEGRRGRFREAGQEAGVALGESGRPRAGMGIDAAAIRNDEGLAIAIGNFSGEGLALFDRGPGVYQDIAQSTGLVPASFSRLTFGLAFLDADRDGWQDLVTCNGHVDPLVAEKGSMVTFKEQPQLFQNRSGSFADVTSLAGPPFQARLVGRGLAWGDWDNDGRPDLVLCENGGPVHLLKNVTADARHWLGVRLRGKGARSVYGAEVRLTAGGTTQRRWVRSGSTYLSQNDPRPLFGLGDAARVDRLEVQWPSGRVTTLEGPASDRYLDVSEP